MKQYLSPEQTAKLIELGFEKPKFEIETQLCNIKGQPLRAATIVGDYSIGELIEMLPMEDRTGERSMVYDGLEWVVNWDNDDGTINQVVATELIDALYDMVIILKRQGIMPND